MDTTIVSV